jgi:hypothetical protein
MFEKFCDIGLRNPRSRLLYLIQDVSGGIVDILGGGSMDYSE